MGVFLVDSVDGSVGNFSDLGDSYPVATEFSTLLWSHDTGYGNLRRLDCLIVNCGNLLATIVGTFLQTKVPVPGTQETNFSYFLLRLYRRRNDSKAAGALSRSGQ